MTAWQLLLVYCPAIAAASLAGGFIPHFIRLTHTRLQTALSFVAGAMLGVGLLHLIPHGFSLLRSIDRTMGCTVVGFLVMFFIERVFHFHHHGTPDEEASGEPAGHDHHCAHGHHDHEHHRHDEQREPASSRTAWSAALLGLTLHSLLDGTALAASISAERAEHGSLRWAGLAVFLVIVLHKPFDSLTLATLMALGRSSALLRHAVNFAYASAVPIGVLSFHVGLVSVGVEADPTLIGGVLALAGGTFLCIATSDLLPELQFHTHDRGKLSLALLTGLALAWGIVFLEERGHDHAPFPSPAPPAAVQPAVR